MASNLQHGTPAPADGTYVCSFCGPGGLAQVMVGPTASLRAGGRLRESDLRVRGWDRVSVYNVTEGALLPQCPTCGPATGWDQLDGELADHLRARVDIREQVFAEVGLQREHPADPDEVSLSRLKILTDKGGMRASVPDTSPCDCCGKPVTLGAGYLLGTRQVVLSEAYWVHAIEVVAPQLDGAPRANQEEAFADLLRLRERDRTPWLICDACTELFVADWTEAREHMLAGTKPPAPGRLRNRLRVADFAHPAARAWTRVRGSWPASVVVPEARPDGACDLCAKPVWPGETVSFVKQDVVDGWVRAGALPARPAVPTRSPGGASGWEICMPCTAGVVARLHRAEQG